jgi:hypothetical protein
MSFIISRPSVPTSPAGNNLDVQFNNNGQFGGSDIFRFSETAPEIIYGSGTANPVFEITGSNSANIFMGSPSPIISTAGTGPLVFTTGNQPLYLDDTGGLAVLNTGGQAVSTLAPSGQIEVNAAGFGYSVKEANTQGKMGIVTLTNGVNDTVVSCGSVTANSRIFISVIDQSGPQSILSVTALVPATSFTIQSSTTTNVSTVAFIIFEPS